MLDQQREVGGIAVIEHAVIAVDVLTQQRDFPDPLCSEHAHFREHLLKRTADFLTTGIGHHTETAVLAAAFHDRDKRRCRVTLLGHRQFIEFFILGK